MRPIKKYMLFGLFLFFFMVFSLLAQGTKGKIRVIVEDASIRMKPDIGSEVMELEVPIGSVFDFKNKTGDWYEIEIRSKLGVMMPGYIHSMYVEEVSGDVVPPLKKKPEPIKPKPVKKPEATPSTDRVKGSFAVRGGMVMATFLGESSGYGGSWGYGNLTSVDESGSVINKMKSPIGLGIEFSYFFLKGLGIQMKVDYNLPQNPDVDESLSTFNMTWYWPTAGPYTVEEAWAVDGELSLMPISLNVIYRADSSGMLVPYFGAGVSFFIGSAKLETNGGFGFPYYSDRLRIEYIDVPLKIDESLSSIGFNFGGGLDVKLASKIALNLDACYYAGKTIEANWEVIPGSYSGNIITGNIWTLDQALAANLESEISSLEIKSSFFRIQAGIKFLF